MPAQRPQSAIACGAHRRGPGAVGEKGVAEVPAFLLVSLLAVWFTYLGFGSILLWAFRFAWVQLGALGTLMSRALPLLMLTVVVYFTGELWQLAARMTRQRLWQTIGFLAAVALVFMIATIRDEVRALREDRSGRADPAALLAGDTVAVDDGALPARGPRCRWPNRRMWWPSWLSHKPFKLCCSPRDCSRSSWLSASSPFPTM